MSGNPLYDKYAKEQFERQTAHGPGTYQRRIHPSLMDLTEEETKVYRKVTTRYDRRRHGTVKPSEFTDGEKTALDNLEGLGFVRIENGRIIPSFVFQEHGQFAQEAKSKLNRLKA